LACTCAAYDVDLPYVWGKFLRAVGLGPALRDPAMKETIVASGNEIRVDGPRVTGTKVPSEALVRRTAWPRIHQKDGWIAFQGETLETVAAEFNHHNGRQLVIGDLATGHLRVGGKFRLNDLDGFLAALERTHGVKAIRSRPNGRKRAVIILISGASGSAYSDESPEP